VGIKVEITEGKPDADEELLDDTFDA
jgi:hypothetical protein